MQICHVCGAVESLDRIKNCQTKPRCIQNASSSINSKIDSETCVSGISRPVDHARSIEFSIVSEAPPLTATELAEMRSAREVHTPEDLAALTSVRKRGRFNPPIAYEVGAEVADSAKWYAASAVVGVVVGGLIGLWFGR